MGGSDKFSLILFWFRRNENIWINEAYICYSDFWYTHPDTLSVNIDDLMDSLSLPCFTTPYSWQDGPRLLSDCPTHKVKHRTRLKPFSVYAALAKCVVLSFLPFVAHL